MKKGSKGEPAFGIEYLSKITAKEVKIPYPDVRLVISTFLKNVMETALLGITIQLTGFGVFKRTLYTRTVVRNPKTDEVITKEPYWRLNFRLSRRVRRDIIETGNATIEEVMKEFEKEEQRQADSGVQPNNIVPH
jgi:nucleoid DNA-binding protein